MPARGRIHHPQRLCLAPKDLLPAMNDRPTDAKRHTGKLPLDLTMRRASKCLPNHLPHQDDEAAQVVGRQRGERPHGARAGMGDKDTRGGQPSRTSSLTGFQELGSMYDYLAKIILLGPSGCGK